MDDGSLQVARALIADVEYHFVEKLASAADGGEVVVCEAPDGARRYATCEAWEAGCSRFETRRSADEGVVTSASSSADKLSLFNSLFAMRGDVYAKSYFNKKTGRVGYAPACAHEWERGVCGKLRVKCADCPHREFLSLDGEVLKAHFRGTGREGVGIVAGYPLSATTRRVCSRSTSTRMIGGRRSARFEGYASGRACQSPSSARGRATARMRGCSSVSRSLHRTPASSDALC